MKVALQGFVIAWLVAFDVSLACAQRSPGMVDGEMWLSSTPEVRKAFLIGAANMIALEAAYSKKKGTPAPVAGTLTTKAVDRLTLDQISQRLTTWYEANPDRRDAPVMSVVWTQIVQPGGARK